MELLTLAREIRQINDLLRDLDALKEMNMRMETASAVAVAAKQEEGIVEEDVEEERQVNGELKGDSRNAATANATGGGDADNRKPKKRHRSTGEREERFTFDFERNDRKSKTSVQYYMSSAAQESDRNWYPPTANASIEVRSRKKRKLLQDLRAIDEMKAQLSAHSIGAWMRHGETRTRARMFRSASSISNALSSRDLSPIFHSLPQGMREALSSGDEALVSEYLSLCTGLLHKPYMSRKAREHVLKDSLPETRMGIHLREGDILHVPFNMSERQRFYIFLTSTPDALDRLDVIARQLPGRTPRDCRRFYDDEFCKTKPSETKPKGYLDGIIRVTKSRPTLNRSVSPLATSDVKDRNSSDIEASRECLSHLYPNRSKSLVGLLLSREKGGLSSRKKPVSQHLGQRDLNSSPSNPATTILDSNLESITCPASQPGLNRVKHRITRMMFGRLNTEPAYQENTGGSITDVKFGTHPHTQNKIIYGVTDTNLLHCAVYDTDLKERKLLEGHTDAVEEVHITEWNYITGSHDTNINIYSLNTELDWKFTEHKDKVLSMSMHSAKPLFASAALQSNKLWLCNFMNRGKSSITLPMSKPTVAAGAMTFGNEAFAETLAIGAQDETKRGTLAICMVNPSHASILDTIETPKPVQCVARPPSCSPLARKFVFSCSEECLYFYDTRNAKRSYGISGQKSYTIVEVKSEKFIRFSSKKAVGHNIHDCSFSPNGLLLQSCGEDNTVIVHDVRRFDRPLHVLEHEYTGGHSGVACQWSLDSNFLVSGADDCTVRIWSVGRATGNVETLGMSWIPPRVSSGNGGDSEVNVIQHNQSGAICALSLSTGSDMVVAGSTSGRIVLHGMHQGA